MHARGPEPDFTLAARFEDPTPMTPAEVGSVGAQLASALQAWHRGGRRRGDLTPAAVGIAREPDGRLLASLLPGVTDDDARFLAPEQRRGGPVGPAADVYALGVLLLQGLLGRADDPPVVAAELGAAWRYLLTGMLAASAADRPTTDHVARTLAGVPGATDTAADAPTDGEFADAAPADTGPRSRLLPAGEQARPRPVAVPRGRGWRRERGHRGPRRGGEPDVRH